MPSTAATPAVRADDDEHLVADLRTGVMRLRRRLVNERHPANELSLGHMAVLAMLKRHGDLTPSRLAALERVQPPSMTRTVHALEEQGLVQRVPHATDGRVTIIRLTEPGVDVLAADRERRDAWLARRLDELPATEREALRLAAPVLLRLAQED